MPGHGPKELVEKPSGDNNRLLIRVDHVASLIADLGCRMQRTADIHHLERGTHMPPVWLLEPYQRIAVMVDILAGGIDEATLLIILYHHDGVGEVLGVNAVIDCSGVKAHVELVDLHLCQDLISAMVDDTEMLCEAPT